MRESETFGIQSGFADQAIEWMNDQAKQHNFKFEARSNIAVTAYLPLVVNCITFSVY